MLLKGYSREAHPAVVAQETRLQYQSCLPFPELSQQVSDIQGGIRIVILLEVTDCVVAPLSFEESLGVI